MIFQQRDIAKNKKLTRIYQKSLEVVRALTHYFEMGINKKDISFYHINSV